MQVGKSGGQLGRIPGDATGHGHQAVGVVVVTTAARPDDVGVGWRGKGDGGKTALRGQAA